MKAAEIALVAVLGALVALAIVGAVSAALERFDPISQVLVDAPREARG